MLDRGNTEKHAVWELIEMRSGYLLIKLSKVTISVDVTRLGRGGNRTGEMITFVMIQDNSCTEL